MDKNFILKDYKESDNKHKDSIILIFFNFL